LPSYVAATTIGDIFKSHYIEARPSWKKVPLTVRKMWFTEFLVCVYISDYFKVIINVNLYYYIFNSFYFVEKVFYLSTLP